MLYEALTGALPFAGAPLQMLAAKQSREPPPPRARDPRVPEDLDALCVDLLRASPGARPDGREVLARLSRRGESLRVVEDETSVVELVGAPFIGRERELATLREAFARVREGAPALVHVRGESGMGKTALVQHFLDEARRTESAVVLSGRCYERETVPYKGIDSVVDAATAWLEVVPPHEVAELLPRDVRALVRLFPVLDRVEEIARTPRQDGDAADVHEVRRRGFAALRELFDRVAARYPLVIHVDDAQWGGADSAALLAEILREPGAPRVLAILSYRGDDAAKSVFLRQLPGELRAGDAVRDVVVGPLEGAQATALAAELLGYADADAARAVAAESGQSPFFLHALSEAVRRRRRAGGDVEPKLASVLADRFADLGAEERRLLEIVAASGRPLALGAAQRAADLGPADARDAIAALCDARLLRRRGARGDEEIETFHDRVREGVLARIPKREEAALHLCVGAALEEAGNAEPHVLAMHFARGGSAEKAARYAVLAGDRAAEALAFEEAAAHYRAALDAASETGIARRALLGKLGDALANAGRGAEAARAYVEAIEGASSGEALDLRRRAAENLLRSGYVDEGTVELRRVLAAVGLGVPASRIHAALGIVARRAELRLRGLGFRERAEHEIAPRDLARIDACWTAALGFGMVDPVRSACFQAENALASLRAGEPYRVARALAFEAGLVATAGQRTRRRVDELFAVATPLAQRLGHPHAIALCELTTGLARYCFGDFRASLAALDRADALLRERCTGVPWERASARAFAAWDLFLLGDLVELSRRMPLLLREADERGDRYFATQLRTCFSNAYWLARGEPDVAEAEVEASMRSWSKADFHLQHFLEIVARAQILLYRGDGAGALRLVDAAYPALVRSLTLEMAVARVFTHHLRGRAALASRSRADLGVAERSARAIERERADWGAPLAALLRAGVAAKRGEGARTLALLADARRDFEARGMALFAVAARLLLGERLGGDAGRALAAGARDFLREQRIADPERMIAMLAPGFTRGDDT
jgi:hypothetical protein